MKRIVILLLLLAARTSVYAAVYETTGHTAAAYEKDIAILRKVIADDARKSSALERMVILSFVCERFDDAVSYGETYLRYYKNPKIAYLRALSLACLGRYKEAAESARSLLSDPSISPGDKKSIEAKIALFEDGIRTGGVPSGARVTEWGGDSFTAGIIDRDKTFVGVRIKTGTPFLFSVENGEMKVPDASSRSGGLGGLNILAVSVSPDGREMFATCGGENGSAFILHRRFDIESDKWSEWTRPGFAAEGTINSFANMLGDGEHLLFVSNRNRGSGLDVYVTRRNESGVWENAVPVKNINTAMDECSLYIHPDGETAYFSTNGRGGSGGYDLFVGSLSSVKGEFSVGNIVNLKHLNTFRNEAFPLYISGTSGSAFYTFRRNDSSAIFAATADAIGNPFPVLYLDVATLDAATKEPVRATVKLVRIGDRTSGITLKSVTDGKGRAPFTVRRRSRYTIDAVADGYAYYTESFETADQADSVTKTIYLEKGKVKTGFTFTADNMYYDSGSAHLRAESVPALERLYEFMKTNPGVKVEIAGHTDNVGGYRYNMDLSQRRADSVAEYLVSRGIKRARITTKGYGYSSSVGSNTTEEGRQKNRRVEITVKSSD